MLKRKSDQLAALRAVSLFSSMSDRELKTVMSGCREELYSDGQAIVKEGQPGGPFFLITEGSAKLLVNNKVRKTYGPGDYFGEMAMIDKQPRSATIVAAGPVKALAIASWDFLALCQENWSITHKVLTGMAGVIRTLDKNADL